MLEIKIGAIIKLKSSKLQWRIFRISDKNEIYLISDNAKNDGRSIKCFTYENLITRM